MKKLCTITIAVGAIIVGASQAQLTLNIYEDYMTTPGQTNLVISGYGAIDISVAGLPTFSAGGSAYNFQPTLGNVILGTDSTQNTRSYNTAIPTISFGTMDVDLSGKVVTTDGSQVFGLNGANLILPDNYAGESLFGKITIEDTTFADFGITETYANQRNEVLLNGQLNVNVIPEPGSVLLLTGSVMALTTIRRNKKLFANYRKLDDC
jgi:hypothetical protein